MHPNARPIDNIANPGVKAEHELAKGLRAEVARLLGRSQYSFPGAQPVSFCRKHINELRREE
jgi:mRNA guanylyltransferase